MPIVVVLCTIGAYATTTRVFNIYVMLAFGVDRNAAAALSVSDGAAGARHGSRRAARQEFVARPHFIEWQHRSVLQSSDLLGFDRTDLLCHHLFHSRSRRAHTGGFPSSASAGVKRPGAMDFLTAADLPERFATVPELEDFMTRPTEALVEDLLATPGDILILGVAGKMGPTLARLARNAAPSRRIIAVARFSEPSVVTRLQRTWHRDDLVRPARSRSTVAALPRAPNVIFMAGRKFGSAGLPSLTWAMNTHLPAIVAQSFPRLADRRVLHRQRLPARLRDATRERTSARRRLQSANTRNPASAASGCSSISRTPTARRAACSA